MQIPLPSEITRNISGTAPNLSLKYYKWANFYEENFTKVAKGDKNKNPKYDFLNSFISLSAKDAYNQAFKTRKNLMEGIGIAFPMATTTRLVFGMGYEHPTEIGFMFDWTTGLPIIPGSSLKGIARYAAEIEGHDCIKEIFGTEKGDAQAGEIIFFPAYPCLEDGQKFLEMDVMTPHYAPYYSSPGQNPPADWYSPVPLHFLTVPEGIKYCFRLAYRKNLKDNELPLLKQAENILKCALAEFGVGAKTAVSYGYFK